MGRLIPLLLLLPLLTALTHHHLFAQGLQCYNCYSINMGDGGEEEEDSWCRAGGILNPFSVVTCTRKNSLVFRFQMNSACPIGLVETNTWTGIQYLEESGQVPRDQEWTYGCAKIGIVGKYNKEKMLEMQRFCMAIPADEARMIKKGDGPCRTATKSEWDADKETTEDLWTRIVQGDISGPSGGEELGCGGVSEDSIVTGCYCTEDKCNGEVADKSYSWHVGYWSNSV